MSILWTWFWAAMIFLSIAWYAILLVYLGIKGGREIVAMTKTLSRGAQGEERRPSQ